MRGAREEQRFLLLASTPFGAPPLLAASAAGKLLLPGTAIPTCIVAALMDRGALTGIGRPADILRPDVLQPAFSVLVAVDAGSDGHPVLLPLRAMRTSINQGNQP